MQKYKATVSSKSIQNGLLTVKVVFQKNDTSFEETFQSSQAKDLSWLEELVNRKLDYLNKIEDVFASVQVNEEIKEPTPTDTGEITDRELYAKNLQKFEKFVSVLSKGFTTQENQDFIALKGWLTVNFKTEYLDLFS